MINYILVFFFINNFLYNFIYFLVGNQKCISCQANEKIHEMLSNEIAEKTNDANILTQKCHEVKHYIIYLFLDYFGFFD